MGIDIHIGDFYFVVGQVPFAVGIIVLAVVASLGAWKLAKVLWLLVAG